MGAVLSIAGGAAIRIFPTIYCVYINIYFYTDIYGQVKKHKEFKRYHKSIDRSIKAHVSAKLSSIYGVYTCGM
jgi:hypothetical protein